MKIYIYEIKLGYRFCYSEEDVTEGVADYMPAREPAYFRPNHEGRLYKADEGTVKVGKTGNIFLFLTKKDDEKAQKAFHDFYMNLHEKLLLLAKEEEQFASDILLIHPVKVEE